MPLGFYPLSTAPLSAFISDILFDATSNSGYQPASSTFSWNHTCSGSNRFLAVNIEILSIAGTTVTGITYNSVSLTNIGSKSSISGADRVECWGLKNPSSGVNSIAVTLSASVASIGTAISYTGVHQTSPTESFNSAQGTNTGTGNDAIVIIITPVTDKTRILAACVSDDIAITEGKTARNNVSGATGSGADEDTTTISPAVATSMNYTNIGITNTWVIAGYAIRPISASSLIAFIFRKTLSNIGTRIGTRQIRNE